MPDPRTGHIVVEVKTPGTSALISYTCSQRVIALPTGQLNAKRYAGSFHHLLAVSGFASVSVLRVGTCCMGTLCAQIPPHIGLGCKQKHTQEKVVKTRLMLWSAKA